MILFPNAKINLGLNILKKRPDGFHDIESLMYPVNLTDILTIDFTNRAHKKLDLTISGIELDGNPNDNLVSKAYFILDNDFNLPSVKINLHKVIPTGAGLGGGSADAAFTLKGLNDLFNLQISQANLEKYAAQLGSDCAFFINNKPAMATGRGEILKPINIDLSGYYLAIIIPQVHVSTKDAYSRVIPQVPDLPIHQVVKQELKNWKDTVKNDFEPSVFSFAPEIGHLKDELYRSGADFAIMSGSGASVYGLFSHRPELSKLLQSKNFTWITQL